MTEDKEIEQLKEKSIRHEEWINTNKVIIGEIRKEFSAFKKEIRDKLDNLGKQFDDKTDMIVTEITRQVTELRGESDDKYSSKWTEKVWLVVFSTIGLGFIGGILYLLGWGN